MSILALVTRSTSTDHRTLSLAVQQSRGDLGSAVAVAVVGMQLEVTGFSPEPLLLLAAATALVSAAVLLRAADVRDGERSDARGKHMHNGMRSA